MNFGEIVAVFPHEDGLIMIFKESRIEDKKFSALLFTSELFLSSLNQSVETYELGAMGERNPTRIVTGFNSSVLLESGEVRLIEGTEDLFKKYDPTNTKSNMELLKILDKRLTTRELNS